MPRRNNIPAPPEVMTRSKAMPVIIAGGIFDILRAFFTLFFFFGPAIGALYCTAKINGVLTTWTLGLLGAKTAAAACIAAAGVVGVSGVEVIEPFGLLMADFVGLAGFLAIGLWIMMTNARIVKAVASAPIQFAGAFAVGEVPFLGVFPVFAVILWRLYGAQIRADHIALSKYNAEFLVQRKQEALERAQIQALWQAQAQKEAQQLEASNEAQYHQAANDEQAGEAENSPDMRRAA